MHLIPNFQAGGIIQGIIKGVIFPTFSHTVLDFDNKVLPFPEFELPHPLSFESETQGVKSLELVHFLASL